MVEQTPIAVRFTPCELRLLDWIARRIGATSRSQCLRTALYRLARYHGANLALQHSAQAERSEIKERTNPELQDDSDGEEDTQLELTPTPPG